MRPYLWIALLFLAPLVLFLGAPHYDKTVLISPALFYLSYWGINKDIL